MNGLVRVPKPLILPIRHSSPSLRRQEGVLGLGLGATALVLPDVVQEQAECGESAAGLGAHDGELGGAVFGGVTGLEGLRADDVAKGEGAGDDGGCEGALGRAGYIGHCPLGLLALCETRSEV